MREKYLQIFALVVAGLSLIVVLTARQSRIQSDTFYDLLSTSHEEIDNLNALVLRSLPLVRPSMGLMEDAMLVGSLIESVGKDSITIKTGVPTQSIDSNTIKIGPVGNETQGAQTLDLSCGCFTESGWSGSCNNRCYVTAHNAGNRKIYGCGGACLALGDESKQCTLWDNETASCKLIVSSDKDEFHNISTIRYFLNLIRFIELQLE